MTVRKFLGMMMMCDTTIDIVALRMRGITMKELDRLALRKEEYCGFGNDHVLTFAVYGQKLILNLRPTF